MSRQRSLRVAFIHPDLGIGGAERLVVDAALGLQKLGHSVDIFTSHHDPNHCFEETRNGQLRVHHIVPPFPRSLRGKLHILFANARQLHLTASLLLGRRQAYDVFFVDQLSTCIPLLRAFSHTRVVFYCHFPDKLLANGAFVEGVSVVKSQSLLKWLYRLPVDWLEEVTTRQADIILANSKFTARVFKAYFPSIPQIPSIVYPGINLEAYEATYDSSDPDTATVISDRPTLISLNRFEGKKNIILAVEAFAKLKLKTSTNLGLNNLRLVLAGGYDPRLEDNEKVLAHIQALATALSLTYNVISPSPLPFDTPRSHPNPDILIVLNFITPQRTALLCSSSTLALLYTPENEHFGIVPIEAMSCGLPVLACNSGGPVESIVVSPPEERTGWLQPPDSDVWSEALLEIVLLSKHERNSLAERARMRARNLFGMDAMARHLEDALGEVASLGPVDVFGIWRTIGVILIGFLLAYVLGPLVLSNL